MVSQALISSFTRSHDRYRQAAINLAIKNLKPEQIQILLLKVKLIVAASASVHLLKERPPLDCRHTPQSS